MYPGQIVSNLLTNADRGYNNNLMRHTCTKTGHLDVRQVWCLVVTRRTWSRRRTACLPTGGQRVFHLVYSSGGSSPTRPARRPAGTSSLSWLPVKLLFSISTHTRRFAKEFRKKHSHTMCHTRIKSTTQEYNNIHLYYNKSWFLSVKSDFRLN